MRMVAGWLRGRKQLSNYTRAMRMQGYWSRLQGAIIFVLALLALQVTRVLTSNESAAGLVLEFGLGALAIVGVPAVVLAIYRRRGAPARERRTILSADSSRTWIADINIDSHSLSTIASPGPQEGPAPRDYALASKDGRFELWGSDLVHGPAAEIEFRSVLGISAPLNGTFYGAGQFELLLTDSDVALGVQMVNPVLSGVYPASPGQVDRVLRELQQLVDEGQRAAPGL